MLVDSHCHLDLLDLTPFEDKLEGVIAQALEQGVETILSISVTLDRLPYLLEQASAHPNVYVSCGLHPNEEPGAIPTVESLCTLARHPKIIAIGETGLDTYRSEGDLSWQNVRFAHHIQAAKILNKPLIIHTREAKSQTLDVLIQEKADEIGGVIHCFTEDWEMAKSCLDLGFYIAFSGIVTFKNAKALQEVSDKIPIDRLLVETDAPFLTPVPNRGKPNYPANVRDVAQFLADRRGMPLEELAHQTTENFHRCFQI